MSCESYYAPTKNAQKVTLVQLTEKFSVAGLPCKTESEAENMFWLVFETCESNILASIEGETFVFGTFYFYSDDPLSVPEIVERVMQSIGFSADESADY